MTTTADPFLAAAREIIERSQREMREALAGLPVEALNWRPAGPDSNSLAVLATHVLGSTRYWLAIALGAPLHERDRAAEFRAEAADTEALLRFVDSIVADCLALIDTSPSPDWSALRQGAPSAAPSAAWALLHALEHLGEHTGQMLLTRQLWEHRPQ